MSQTAPVDQAERWRQLDVDHHLNPFSDYRSLKKEEGGSRIINRAEGVRLYDVEGQELLDGMSGLWCVQVGYGQPSIVAAVSQQMEELPYYNSFFKTTTPPTVELAGTLARLTPDGLDRVFFGSSGSESNDTVVRLVRWYNHVLGRPEKNQFISRNKAYHGSTMAAASLGGLTGMQTAYGLPLPGFHHVMPPYSFELANEGESDEEFGVRAARAVEEKILELGAENVAAFIGEPVMGAGGLMVPPETYWPEIVRICREHDVLLIADEVICGFGRTGEWFGCQTYGFTPDIMTLAKGITSGYLPLSAVMVSDAICEVFEEKGGEFAHGYTYSGHPTVCAAALANIGIMQREKIVEQAAETGTYLEAELKKLYRHRIVGEIRGIGMVWAVELMADRESRKNLPSDLNVGTFVRDWCWENGMILRNNADILVIAPALVITKEEIDIMVGKINQVIELIMQKFELG